MEDFSLEVQILVQIHVVWAAGHWIQEGGGCIEGNVHIKIAILDFLDLDRIVSDVHGVDPGVLQHLAADVDVQVLSPFDDAVRNCRFEEVGVVDGLIVSLFGSATACVGDCEYDLPLCYLGLTVVTRVPTRNDKIPGRIAHGLKVAPAHAGLHVI